MARRVPRVFVGYREDADIHDALTAIARDRSLREGRDVALSEVVRAATAAHVASWKRTRRTR